MAYPTTPTQDYGYTAFAQSQGTPDFPGPALDNDLLNLASSLAEFSSFLEISFRSDGLLKDTAIPDVGEILGEANATLQLTLDAALRAENAATDATHQADLAATAAGLAATAAGLADIDADRAKSEADRAKSEADRAKSEADRAAQIVDGFEPDTGGGAAGALMASANLSDLEDPLLACGNLGLGALSRKSTVEFSDLALELTRMLVPEGTIAYFLGTEPPFGWMTANGQWVGGDTSPATMRGPQFQALFRKLWLTSGVTIYDADSQPTNRGASPADDFLAGKCLATPDLRGQFIRVWDNFKGVDTGRAPGTYQAESTGPHTHSVSGTAASAGAHTHTVTTTSYADDGSIPGLQATGGVSSGAFTINSSGAHTHTVTGTAAANAGTENRPSNFAFLACIKL